MDRVCDGCIPGRLVPSQLWAPGAGAAFPVYKSLALGDPRSASDLPGHVNAGPTFFLLQLPEWEGSRRSSPEGSSPPSLLSVPYLGRDLLLQTAARGDRKEKGKLTDGREKRVPSAARIGQTHRRWPQTSPSYWPRPTCAQSLEPKLPVEPRVGRSGNS